ncbi:MAG: hypothetical protein RIS90_3312, partial [Pseudomonadota bacterium]
MAGLGLLSIGEHAWAGGQLEEPLADAVRTALSSAVANAAPPVPEFADGVARQAYQRWLAASSARLIRQK